MCKISYVVSFLFLLIVSCSTESQKSSESEKNRAVLYNGYLDSIVHVYHEPVDMLENELVLIENDSLLQHMLNDESFNVHAMEKLKYYYNSKIILSDKNEIGHLLDCFPLVDEKEEKYSPKCVAFYRDIYQFYSNGNLMGVMKICFTCEQYSFHIYDGDFMKQMDVQEQWVHTDFDKLEKLAAGYLN